MRVVPAFDVAEEDEARVRVRREAMLRQTFTCERAEKAFRHMALTPLYVKSLTLLATPQRRAAPRVDDHAAALHRPRAHVPLQTPDDVLLRETLLRASDDVVDGRLVPLHADQNDPIECGIGLTVPAAEQPMSIRHAT